MRDLARFWMILRTSNRGTLQLAESLGRHGFDVWTPASVIFRRAPRRRQSAEFILPLLPSFVFARAVHALDMLEMAECPTRPCREFSVFHFLGDIPLVEDDELTPLRRREEQDRRRAMIESRKARPHPQFADGTEIRINDGAFSGMSGIVEHDDGRFARIRFGSTSVKISTSILSADNIISPANSVASDLASVTGGLLLPSSTKVGQ